jgi:hypothetical protein
MVVMPSDAQLDNMTELGNRADAIRKRQVKPEEDNMLKVCSDGRKAALDLRLLGQHMDVPGKIGAAADRIAALWRQHRDDAYPGRGGGESPVRGSLQLVFSDIGTPGDDWNVYDELRDQLAARGMPREMIRFVHDARSDRDKGELFAACRAGSVAVLIGSTEKMGVGTNVQLRATALHHLDCPWRPADVAQREGRILRQGNHNPEVQIIRYVTERSFDGYMWQTVERKSRFIAQVMRGKLDVREIEDIGDAALSYNEVKALATGNPLLMEKAEADADLTRLERAERAWHRNLDALAHKVNATSEQIAALDATAAQIDAAIARRRDTRGDAFAMIAGGSRHIRRQDAGEHLKALIADQDQALTRSGHRRLIEQPGELGGFPLAVTTERVLATVSVTIQLVGAPGTEIRMTPAEVAAADPGKIIVRLEGRLAGLEALKAKTLTEISRLTTEASHARDDLRKPFPQADRLAAARDRAQQIDGKLSQAARPPRPTPGPSAPALPDWARTALHNPGDPRWLAAAAMQDGVAMAGIPGSAVAVITHPEPPESPAQAASLDFPAAGPTPAPAPAGSAATARPGPGPRHEHDPGAHRRSV